MGGAANPELWRIDLTSRVEFSEWHARESGAIRLRRDLQRSLAAGLSKESRGTFPGYCEVCSRQSEFLYDWQYSGAEGINWRERLVCTGCQLSNRLRLAVHVAAEIVDLRSASIYVTEQTTPLAEVLSKKCCSLTCSEFLGQEFPRGQTNARGLRHEDLTCLSFGDGQFDLVMSFDVLEHIPNYCRALREARRVLKPGGTFLISVPMHLGSDINIVRAISGPNGEVKHLLEPEYHGDPVDPAKGILCFYHFGWDLLGDLRYAGFASSKISLFWSSDFAYIGDEQVLITATA